MSDAGASGAANNASIVTTEKPTDADAWVWVGFLASALEDAIDGLNMAVATGVTNVIDPFIDRAQAAFDSYLGMKAEHDADLKPL
jgi:hypothetical protein